MKKFVGLVNGKSFDNVEDWTKAAQEAIRNDSENLAISSYYTNTCDDAEKVDEPNDDKYVSTSEYFLGDRKPDSVCKLDSSKVGTPGYTNLEYTVSPELDERLKVASNKDSIKKSVDFHVTNLLNAIQKGRKELKEIEKNIEDLQKGLYDTQEVLLDQEARRKYYNHILDVVEIPEQVDDCGDKECDCKKKEYVKPEVKSGDFRKKLGFSLNMSLFDILNELGIL